MAVPSYSGNCWRYVEAVEAKHSFRVLCSVPVIKGRRYKATWRVPDRPVIPGEMLNNSRTAKRARSSAG